MTEDGALRQARLIARGFSAEVFSWGEGRVLKLFLPGFSSSLADYEARCSAAVSRCALPVARLIERIEIDGRCGLVFEHVPGISGLELLGQKPFRIRGVLREMARVQNRINGHKAPEGLRSLHEILAQHICVQPSLSSSERTRILAHLDRLPEGEALCHADLHPGQILFSPEGVVVIDWANAARATPAADVARSCLLLSLGPPVRQPWLARLVRIGLGAVVHSYLSLRLDCDTAGIDAREIEAWRLPMMAARLGERVPGEEAYLLSMIRARIARDDRTAKP